jgi:hypothetical protein
MDIDNHKIDDVALALMYLTLHDHFRAWKQIDWNVTNRLHELAASNLAQSVVLRSYPETNSRVSLALGSKSIILHLVKYL